MSRYLQGLCVSGISGNMMIGALLDYGVPFRYLQDALQPLGLSDFEYLYESSEKQGVRGTYFDVKIHNHSHSRWFNPFSWHSHKGRRNYPEIKALIESTPLSSWVKTKSLEAFWHLGEAEAKVHRTTLEKVHFHEVGAVDCIIDIVGTMCCLEYLDVTGIVFSPLHVGQGKVRCDHGLMDIPTPATTALLEGFPTYVTHVLGELVTPTGATLVKTLSVNTMAENEVSDNVVVDNAVSVTTVLERPKVEQNLVESPVASDVNIQKAISIMTANAEVATKKGVGLGSMDLPIPNVFTLFEV